MTAFRKVQAHFRRLVWALSCCQLSALRSCRLSFLSNRGAIHRLHVKIEESFLLVSFVLVLFAQLNYFFDHLDVEAFAFCFCKNFLFAFVQFGDFSFDVLDTLDERADAAAGNTNVTHGGSLI